MRNFLTKSVPGLLAITVVAALGYFVLTPPSMRRRGPRPEIGVTGRVFALPAPARWTKWRESRLGIDALTIETASKAIH